jgi:cell wall-associated NlpC family hydrolase
MDFEAFLAPFFQGRDGTLTGSWEDLPYRSDPLALDPFEEFLDIEARREFSEQEQIQARRLTTLDAPDALDTGLPEGTDTELKGLQRMAGIKLPTAATRGERVADTRAALRGVDPSNARGAGGIIDLAKTQLGTNYVFGASNPGVAFDCSGFAAWAYQRAFGISLPHQSTAQAEQLNKVERDDLQPGDLVFFSYGRLGAGVIDHVEIYMGDGRMIGTANTTDDLDIDQVDWEHFVQGGRADGVVDTGGGPKNEVISKVKQVPVEHTQTLAPLGLSSGAPAFSAVIDALFSSDTTPIVTEKVMGGTAEGSVERQLQRGFIDAGRPDLARMVGTKEFDAWIRAESGWRPDVVSQYYEGHGVNYGLFQFWEGHAWTQQYVKNGEFTASPYQQAKLVAKYFGHLTPAKIREYAEQVRNGDYHGWG